MSIKNPYSIIKIKPTTNIISKNIKELEEETLNNLRNSKANNTLRAYTADYKDFSVFCTKNNFQSMPTEPKVMALYLTYLSKKSKYSTLKRRLASISVLNKMKGHYFDTKHPIIIENLMGIKRANGSNQKSKKPILISDLKALIKAIHQSLEKELRKTRDKAIVLIGCSGGFRRSELVSIDYEDLEFVVEGVKIFVKRSKTDQSGEGMTKAIPYFENEDFCPVIALKNWIEVSEIKKNKTKGWNYHKKYWCILCVPFGQVKFNFRNKLESKSKSITIGKKNYSTIIVPPKTYFSFKSNVKISLVANTINGAHHDNETIKIPII